RSRDDKNNKSERKCFRCRYPNHLIGECLKPPKDKNQRAFIEGSWSDNGEKDDEKAKDETCLVAQASNEICLGVDLEPDEWIKDNGCSKHMTINQKLFSIYKAHNGGNVIFGINLLGNIIGKGQICDNKCRVTFSKHDSEITKDDKSIDEEEAIKVTEKKNLKNDIEDETLEIDAVVNIKESRNHPLENVIENLNQRTLRLVAQGYNQQEGIDYHETYASVARLESIRILLAYACALDFKLFQMDVKSAILNGLINEEVYVAQPSRFIDFEKPDLVYKLKKALYGLKQAPKAWFERYNLAYFIAKRMEFITKQPRLILPYGMLLTRLFEYVMSSNPELSTDRYILYDRVMYPLTAQQDHKTQKDYGTRRCRSSTSSSSAFGQPLSSHLHDDDNDGNDEGTSHASTSSPTRFVNSLTNEIPQVFSNPPNIDPNMEPFYTRQTKILNRQLQLRDEQCGGIRSTGKGIKNIWRKKKK
ncbi:retrovirus-related pol polyprotein from transposon TNT 1-94, partial [Tanacetum coccineum]